MFDDKRVQTKLIEYGLVFIVIAGVGFLVSLSFLLVENIILYGLIFLLFAIATFPLFYLLTKGTKVDIFSPVIIFPIFYLTIYGLGSIALIIRGAKIDIERIILYAIIGLITWFIGCYAGKISFLKRGFQSLKRLSWNRNRLYFTLFVLMSIGLFALGFIYYKAGVPILSQDILDRENFRRSVSSYSLYSLRFLMISFFFLLTAFSFNKVVLKKNRIFLFIFFIFILIILLSMGWRNGVFTLIMTSLAIYHYTVKRIPLSKFVIILILLTVFFIGFAYYRLTTYPESATLAYIEHIVGASFYKKFLFYLSLQFAVYSSNFFLVTEMVPDVIPFLYGKVSLLTLSTALPGKQLTLGEILKESAGLTYRGGGVNPTLLGEIYVDFGPIGIPIMMFLLGAISSKFYRNMKRNPSEINILWYSFVISSLLLGVIIGVFSNAIFIFMTTAILLIHIFAKRRGKSYDTH